LQGNYLNFILLHFIL